MTTQRLICSALGACLTLTVLAGCATSSTQPRPSPRHHQSFSTLRGLDLGRIELAYRTIVNRCLADAGFPQNLRTMMTEPVDFFGPMRQSVKGFEPASEREARRRGFGWDAAPQPASVVSYDPAYDKVLGRCGDTARTKLGKATMSAYLAYVDLGNQLMSDLAGELGRRTPHDTNAKLYSCLVSKHAKPKSRSGFLREPNPRTQFDVELGRLSGPAAGWKPDPGQGGVQVGPAVPARHYTPTPAEAELAVVWFRCSRDTGRTAAFETAGAEAERSLMRTYGPRLAALDPALDRAVVRACSSL
jgi:hypothetical protein